MKGKGPLWGMGVQRQDQAALLDRAMRQRASTYQRGKVQGAAEWAGIVVALGAAIQGAGRCARVRGTDQPVDVTGLRHGRSEAEQQAQQGGSAEPQSPEAGGLGLSHHGR